jgi:osmotically inducible lipoprotein OsmB
MCNFDTAVPSKYYAGSAKALTRVLLAAGLSVSVGCTEPGQMTEIGAATGGVLGAGLGAIVGSQTGDPGAGLVIGAAAGATSGALVANALEAQQQAIQTQDEAIERQEQMIRAQNAEIEELRRSFDGGRSAPTLKEQLRQNLDQQSGQQALQLKRGSFPIPATQPRASQAVSQGAASQGAVSQESMPLTRGSKVAAAASGATQQQKLPQRTGNLSERDITPHAEATERYAATTGATNSASQAQDARAKLAWQGEKAAAIDSQPAGDDTRSTQVEPQLPLPLRQASVVDDAVSQSGDTSAECQRAAQERQLSDKAFDSADKLFHLRRALRLCPGRSEYHLALAELYMSLNKPADAEFELQEVMLLEPGHERAKKLLQTIASSKKSEKF